MLAQQSVSVRRGILENDIDPHMAYALGAHLNVKDDTSIDDCLNILKEIFMEKNPIWFRRKMWFECVQKDNESVTQWWNRKLEIAKQCDLEHMKPDELAMLQFMMGINRKEKKIRDEFLKQKDPKLADLLNIAKNWQRSGDLGRDLDNVEVKKAVTESKQCNCQRDSDDEDVVDAKKTVSNYRQSKDKSWKDKHQAETNSNDKSPKKKRTYCQKCSKKPTPGGSY